MERCNTAIMGFIMSAEISEIIERLDRIERDQAILSGVAEKLANVRSRMLNIERRIDEHGLKITNSERQQLSKLEVKKMLGEFLPKKEFENSISSIKDEIDKKVSSTAGETKSLTIQDVKKELEDYELTKNVNAKIKSCRNTIIENYENHAKRVDEKVSALTNDVDKQKVEIESIGEKIKLAGL